MGLIKFAVHPASLMTDWPEVHRAFLGGMEGRIYPTRIDVQDNIIQCRRITAESCKFCVGWPVPGVGRPVISTASLPEREEPYLLAVELARGKIVQIRNQMSTWEVGGMRVPPQFREPMHEAQRLFARAASSQDQPESASALATESLRQALMAADCLTRAYTQQALAGRQQRTRSLPAMLGCELGHAPCPDEAAELFTAAFNSATVHCAWTEIESAEGNYNWDLVDQQIDWCEDHRLKVRAGSLIDLGPNGMPSWLSNWEHDLLNVQSFVCDFIETAISRYQGRVRTWEVVARPNTGGALTMNEEQRLTMTARVLDIARQVDEEAQLLIRVDQPWGEYQARGQHRLSPLQMTDALLRSGIGLAGVNLEIAFGFLPSGSALRDLLDVSRLIDSWSVLQVPLHLTLAYPSSAEPDSLASTEHDVDPHLWTTSDGEAEQVRWLDGYLPLLLAKPAVGSVSWTNFSDATPHTYPRSGLLRANGDPKPALEWMIDYGLHNR